ncbi:hypothetical protein ILUMI_01318 [Ignelater luminosus]|uniref:Arrestin C-terminal-like domain-containing protein n=1 Tax=Ignelater luminosus TaxID=2038154 RepID=A0A8K0DJX5_IGNLU|nr:hypothetical protein ILUMI_01318 [Ignelater luminosus]
MSSIQVYLDNYHGCCYPGQTIAGRIECHFNKEKNLRAIRIKFKGRAETEWTETESHYNSTTKKHESRHVRYYASEEYFNAEYNLVQGGEGFHLPPGKHTYPFSYIIPAHLPSSFEGSYGNIRYYIKGVVDRPWKFDYEHLFSLNVVSPVDLNYVPGVRDPLATSVDKTMCSCWCNDSGALTFEMSLPATGFVPGQEINIGAHVENMTNVTAECIKFKIIADLEFITHYPRTKHRYDERVIAECREGGVGAHGDKSWTSALTIPNDLPYPNLLPCSIINLSYRLKAKVVVPCPHTNLENEVPVVIGTVPLAGVATTFPASPPTFPTSTEGTPLLPNATPYPGGVPPYPSGGAAFSSGDVDGFEEIKSPSAPTPGGLPYPAPTPPYPSGGAPYPSGGPPYPSGGAPYPPSTSNGFGEKSPSAPSPGFSPYPPYSSDSKSPSGPSETPYPSAPSSSAPYPPGPGGAPYPSGGFSNPSAPSGPGSAPYPPTGAPYASSNSNFAPPSYEEAKEQKEKK